MKPRPRWPRGWLLAALVALILDGLLAGLFYDRFWWPADEGAYAHVAERLLDGEVLNREVADMHAGYINFVNAAALALFGRTMVALRVPLLAVALLQAALIFALLVRQSRAGAVLGAVASLAFGVLQYLDPTAHWYSQALAVAVAFTLARMHPERLARLPLVGALIATAALFRQLTGIFIAMAAVTHLLLEPEPRAASSPGARRSSRAVLLLMLAGLLFYLVRTTEMTGAVLFGAWPLVLLAWCLMRAPAVPGRVKRLVVGLTPGALAAALPLLAYHLAHGSLGSWIRDVVGAANALSQMEFTKELTVSSTLFSGGLSVALHPRNVTDAINGSYIALLTLSAAALGGALLFRLERQRELPPPAFAIMACFYGLVSLHYQNITYLYFSVGLTLVGFLSLALEGPAWQRRVVLAGGTALCTIAVFFHAGQSTNRDFIGILTGERVPVVEAPGLTRCGLRIDRRDLDLYTRALARIDAEVPPGGEILAMPMSSELYFLSGRRNPFRFFTPALDLRTGADVDRALARFSAQPPRLIFYAPEDKYNTLHTRALIDGLRNRYELVEQLGGWEVWRSRAYE